jgi:hypothetical protein
MDTERDRFWGLLPQEPGRDNDSLHEDAAPDLSGLTLLVVDDNADALEVLTFLLEDRGAHALQARNAAIELQLAMLEQRAVQPLMKVRRSALTTPACVVHMPCGNFS